MTAVPRRRFDVAIIGLGYVGLPLAKRACDVGWRVVGYDVDLARVHALQLGQSYVDDISDADVAGMLERGFVPTGDPALPGDAATVVICVPTPLADDQRPDLEPVLSAARTVAAVLRPDTLVVLESTTYPGTTEEVVRPIIEESGLSVGTDCFLAFAPERIDPGNADYPLEAVPRVVGGVTEACTAAAVEFYQHLVHHVVPARSAREAEMAKLIENVYRQVNIALVNELAMVSKSLGVDLWNAIDCASSKPYGFQAFHPGPGVGGHCIPVDPHYLTYKVRAATGTMFRMAELANDINGQMPDFVVRRIADLLNRRAIAVRGSSVLLLGVSYKPDVSDLRGTPAEPIARALLRAGAEVSYHDPHVDDWEVDGKPLTAAIDVDEALRSSDVVVLLQRHAAYDDALLSRCPTLFDASGSARTLAEEVL
jgi:UDP-N-acetyl-D-glucosamine dehydrogenase